MNAHENEQEQRFGPRVGGHPCLDWVNTVAGWITEELDTRKRDPEAPDTSESAASLRVLGDRIRGYADLVDWGEWVEVMGREAAHWLRQEAEAEPAAAGAVHLRALGLREAIYRLLLGFEEGVPAGGEALGLLNREVTVARRHQRLAPGDGALGWAWDDDPTALDRVLWPVAASAADLLTGERLHRVGRCPGEACGWMFLDTSRGGGRRWCDMRLCGNRAKVRRFRARQEG